MWILGGHVVEWGWGGDGVVGILAAMRCRQPKPTKPEGNSYAKEERRGKYCMDF